MWLLVFVPLAIGPDKPEQVAVYDYKWECEEIAAKLNQSVESVKRIRWGEFDCWHPTNPLLRGIRRSHHP